MASDKEILEYAKYYLENDTTMQKCADHFGVSKRTFQNRMKELEFVDMETFKAVQLKKDKNLQNGTVKGGQNGKPTYTERRVHIKQKSISDTDIVRICEYMIDNRLTLRETGEIFGISFTTLHDNLTEERLGKELYQRYVDNAWLNKINTNKGIR